MSANVKELAPESVDQELAEGTVLVDFWAPWCGPCRMQAPILDSVAQKIDGNAKIVKVDVDANPAAAQKFGVMSIPTLVLLKDGQEVRRFVGMQPEGELLAAISSV